VAWHRKRTFLTLTTRTMTPLCDLPTYSAAIIGWRAQMAASLSEASAAMKEASARERGATAQIEALRQEVCVRSVRAGHSLRGLCQLSQNTFVL